MAFCASWQLPKFLFQGSDNEIECNGQGFIRDTDAILVLYEPFFDSANCQQSVAYCKWMFRPGGKT